MGEVKYTSMATQALSLADIFNAFFESKRWGAPTPHALRLGTPDGPSTAGGKQAMQHVMLVPDGPGVTLVVGTANAATNEAILRTHAVASAYYWQRFKGVAFPVAPEQYDAMLSRIESFFRSQRFKVARQQVVPEELMKGGAEHAQSTPLPIELLVGIGAVIVGVIVAAALLW